MQLQIGDQIVWCGDYTHGPIKKGTITKISGHDFYYVDNQHRPEDCIYQHWCWPAEVEQELSIILEQRARLKKEYDDSMSLIYQLRNRVSNASE